MGLSPPCHHRVGSKRFSLEAYRYTCLDEKYYLRRMLVTRDKLNPTRRFLQVRISNCLIGNYSELKLIINYRKCKNVRGNKSLVINKPRPTCTNVYFSCNRSSKRYLACILRGAWQGCVKQCARLCACIRCFFEQRFRTDYRLRVIFVRSAMFLQRQLHIVYQGQLFMLVPSFPLVVLLCISS